MDPIALQKQIRDNTSDLHDFYSDLKVWGEEMKRKDENLKQASAENDAEVPLPRNKVRKTTSNAASESNAEKSDADKSKKTVKRIQSSDYKAWEKFDVEAECAKVDKEESAESDGISDENDEGMRDEAIYEKEKGNKFVRKQRWDEAIECYTRAIECYGYDPIFYANRALCHLKKDNFRAAECDCTTALQLDKTYVKAYQRRAAAREKLNQLEEAKQDLLKVFDYEPNNKESISALSKIEKILNSGNNKTSSITAETIRPKSKFSISRQKQKDYESVVGLSKATIESLSSKPAPKPAEKIKPTGKPKVETETTKTSEIGLPQKAVPYWPSGNLVNIIQPITKPPHLRSKKPLKRISIEDVDLNWEINRQKHDADLYERNKRVTETAQPLPRPGDDKNSNVIRCDDFKVVEREVENFVTTKIQPEVLDIKKDVKEKINQKIITEIENKEHVCVKDEEEFQFAVPKSVVQFTSDWKFLKRREDWTFLYLQKINPSDFATIFKESLESDIFSDIIKTLAGIFVEKRAPVYEYLLGLSEVRRFGTLVMFMSSQDKKELVKIIDYLKADNSISTDDIDILIKKYEL